MWVKLDDHFWLSDKVDQAGWAAVGFHAAAMSYCGQKLNDGQLTARDLHRIGGGWEDLVERLVECGLWDVTDGGWQIHDFLEYNPTAEQVREDRRKTKERQERWREKNKGSTSQDASRNASRDAVSNAAPTRPDPTQVATPPTPPRGERNRRRSTPPEPANPVGEFKGYDLPAQPVPPPPNIRSHLRAVGEAS